MSTEERTITIVDDIMGSGKSIWAINYINDNPDRKFLALYHFCQNARDSRMAQTLILLIRRNGVPNGNISDGL